MIGPIEIGLIVIALGMIAGPFALNWIKSRGGLFVPQATAKRVSPQAVIVQQPLGGAVVQWQDVAAAQDEPVTRDDAFAASETLVRYYRQVGDETGLNHALETGRSLYPDPKSEPVRKVATARKTTRTTRG